MEVRIHGLRNIIIGTRHEDHMYSKYLSDFLGKTKFV